MIKKRISLVAVAFVVMIISSSCTTESNNYKISSGKDLTQGVDVSNSDVIYNFTQEDMQQPEAYEKYSETLIDFSANILSTAYNKSENIAISPITMYKNLALLSNGTQGSTEKQLKDVLGDSVISISNINNCTDYISQRLEYYNTENNYINLGQSMWVKEDMEIRDGFLQKNANFYEDSIYQVDFNSSTIVEDMNNWAKHETQEEVKDIVSEVDKNSSINLLNTISINGAFINPYNVDEITTQEFISGEGKTTQTQYLNSTQRVVKTNEAVAFSKGLQDIPATFVAILPNENIDIEYYISEYLSKQLDHFLDVGEEPEFMNVGIPSFSISTDKSYNKTIEEMGITEIFNTNSNFNNLTSSEVSVTEIAQKVEVNFGAYGVKTTEEKIKSTKNDEKLTKNDKILYNRPFIYLVVDNESNIPVIIGSVNNQQ